MSLPFMPYASTVLPSMVKIILFSVKLMCSLSPPTMNLSTPRSIMTSMLPALPVPIKRQGLLTHYHGIDIIQTRDCITIHVGSYIHMMLEKWLSTFVLLMTFMSRKLSLLSYMKTTVALYSWQVLFNLPRSLAILTLYLRSILEKLHASRTSATVIYDHKQTWSSFPGQHCSTYHAVSPA